MDVPSNVNKLQEADPLKKNPEECSYIDDDELAHLLIFLFYHQYLQSYKAVLQWLAGERFLGAFNLKQQK